MPDREEASSLAIERLVEVLEAEWKHQRDVDALAYARLAKPLPLGFWLGLP